MVAGPSPGSGGSTPPEFWNFQVGVMERTDVLQVMGATLCQDQAVALLLKQFGMDHYTIQVSWSNIQHRCFASHGCHPLPGVGLSTPPNQILEGTLH